MLIIAGRAPDQTEIRQGALRRHRDEAVRPSVARRKDVGLTGRIAEFRVVIDGIAIRAGKCAPAQTGALDVLEDGREIPDRRRRRVSERRRLPADHQHVPRGRIRTETEVMVAKGKLLGEPAVVRDHDIVVDLDRRCRVVAHLEVDPSVAVVLRVGHRWSRPKVAPILDLRAPGRQRREVVIGRLVLLQENHDACHGRPSLPCPAALPLLRGRRHSIVSSHQATLPACPLAAAYAARGRADERIDSLQLYANGSENRRSRIRRNVAHPRKTRRFVR